MSDTITGLIETKVTKQELIDCLPCGYCDIAAAIMDLPQGMHDQLDDALSKLRKRARDVVKAADDDDFHTVLEDLEDLDSEDAVRIEDRIEGMLKSHNDFAYTTRMKLMLLQSLLFDIDAELLQLPGLFNDIRNCIKDIRRNVKEDK